MQKGGAVGCRAVGCCTAREAKGRQHAGEGGLGPGGWGSQHALYGACLGTQQRWERKSIENRGGRCQGHNSEIERLR